MTAMDFWTAFAAVLAANLLTVMFVWALYSYSKLERDGLASEARSTIYIGMALPMFFLIGGLMIALDSVPAWLNFIAQ